MLNKFMEIYKKNGLLKFLRRGIRFIMPTKSILQLRGMKESYDIYNKLYKKYSDRVIIYDYDESMSGINQTIYTAWFQGEENAPAIVKACWESLKRNLKDYSIVVLTENNFEQYIKLDTCITHKYYEKKISMAHFSDIIRTKVLIDYGGIWIDSTVLCTNDRLVSYLKNKNINFFVYQNIKRNNMASALSSWFIYTQKNNPVLRSVYNLLLDYWEKNDNLIDYFLYHKLFTVVVSKYEEQWKRIPVFSNINSHLLQDELFEIFDEERFYILSELSSFHKLTYKFDENNEKKKDTMYQYILKTYCGDGDQL